MKKIFEKIRLQMPIDSSGGERIVYERYIITSMYYIMWGAIVLFSLFSILASILYKDQNYVPKFDFRILIFMNIFSPVAVYFSRREDHPVFGHVAGLVLLLMGNYGTWEYGFPSTYLMFFVLLIVLVGLFHKLKRQVILITLLLVDILIVIQIRGYSFSNNYYDFAIAAVLFYSIGVLQTLSTGLMWRIIDQNIDLSKNLQQENLLRQAREVEIEQMNMSLDAEVRLRTAQLAAKHKELADLSYSMAHDLRAPLRAVVGFNQIIQQENNELLDDNTKELLQRSIEAGHHMDNLIGSIIALSQVGQSELFYEKFDIVEMVRAVFEEIKTDSARENVKLILEGCSEVNADRGLTWILIQNLMSNAMKFGRPEETLEIEFGCKAQEIERIVYYLRDNGIGFSMEYADKVFEPFHRVVEDESVEGIGIGLSIARRVVERHGGTIWAESELGQGTVIYFSFLQP